MDLSVIVTYVWEHVNWLLSWVWWRMVFSMVQLSARYNLNLYFVLLGNANHSYEDECMVRRMGQIDIDLYQSNMYGVLSFHLEINTTSQLLYMYF